MKGEGTMTINLKMPDITELKPRLMVFGVGGAGGNAVNNMIAAGLQGVDFVVANTDAQALTQTRAVRAVQMGIAVTEGLGAGSHPEVGKAAAEEAIDELRDHMSGAHMAFITAGMGGGTGTGAAPVIARVAKEMGILTVGVVTKPFHFEGKKRMRTAEAGIAELQKHVDTLIVIPNQNLFRVANENTTFADAFAMADQVLYSGVACITDLMVKEGLINLDFADVRAVMREMGTAMMGTGESTGEHRALRAAEGAISNPLLDDVSMRGARGLLISVTGGRDMKLYEVDEAATRISDEVDPDANIIVGATFDDSLEGIIRVSVVATGIDAVAGEQAQTPPVRALEMNQRARHGQASVAVPPLAAVQAPVVQPAPVMVAPVSVVEAALVEAVVPVSEPEPMIEEAVSVPTAVLMDPQVSIRQITPQPSAFLQEPQPQMKPEPAPLPQAFIPPAPERPVMPQRMPTVNELPPHAQRQVLQSKAEVAAQAEERRNGFFDRLKHFSGRKDEAAPHVQEPTLAQRPAAPSAGAAPAQHRPVQQVSEPARRPMVSETTPRARQSVDANGRAAAPMSEEDHLEIPAFLRRQTH